MQNGNICDANRRSSVWKAYSISFKIKAVDAVNSGLSKKAVAKTFGVDRRRIQEWCQQKYTSV